MTHTEIGQLAWQALMDEVSATPKPGLVDRNNNGAHTDMTLLTFAASANALKPHFILFARTGAETAGLPEAEAFGMLRCLGRDAEADMYAATNGVNTHKGAVFSLGLLCAAAGRSIGRGLPPTPVRLSRTVKAMTKGLCGREYARLGSRPRHTGGEQVYLKYGVTGARGEAESGFASVRSYGYPRYRELLKNGEEPNLAAVRTLLCLMANVTDTNILHRHDMDTALEVKARAAALHRRFDLEGVQELDRELIRRNISPGGSADLLAATLFLHAIRNQIGSK